MSVCLSVGRFARLYVCPSVCFSVCVFVRMYICPSVCLSVCIFVRLYVCPYLSMCQSVYDKFNSSRLSVRMSGCQSVQLCPLHSACQSVCPAVGLSNRAPYTQPVSPYVLLSVCPIVPLTLSLSVRMSGCQFVQSCHFYLTCQSVSPAVSVDSSARRLFSSSVHRLSVYPTCCSHLSSIVCSSLRLVSSSSSSLFVRALSLLFINALAYSSLTSPRVRLLFRSYQSTFRLAFLHTSSFLF